MWGALAGAAIGAGLNIFGSIKAAGAAKRAGTMQAEAAEREALRARQSAEEVNPWIAESYRNAQQGLSTVANRNADIIEQRARQGYEDVMGQTREANAYLDPYAYTGQAANERLSALAGIGGDPTQALALDPGYQFRLAEGQKALEKSAAARGGILGGGTLKALTRYAQGAASQEFGSAFDRLSSLANRGVTTSTTMGNNLTRGAEFGATLGFNAANAAGGMRTDAARQEGAWGIAGAGTQAQNILDAEREARGLRESAAAARAAGIVGSANAWQQGLGGAASAIGGGLTMADMAKNHWGYGAPRPWTPPTQQPMYPRYPNTPPYLPPEPPEAPWRSPVYQYPSQLGGY